MLRKRHSDLIYGLLQSAITCGVATTIHSLERIGAAWDMIFWMKSWFSAWAVMVPVVIFIAPFIRRATNRLVHPGPKAD